MDYQIFDREGRSYTLSVLENDALLLFRLYDRDTLIGEAKCVRESLETLFLGDIAIANDAVSHSTNVWTALLTKISSYQPKPINYRNRGLGTALLKFLIAHARVLHVQKLYGRVYRQDLENSPKLLQWYKKHGFEIKKPVSGDTKDVVARIYLDLQ